MEGAGPSMGDPVDWRMALAGADALSVDVLAAHLMGHDPSQIGYLVYCHELGLGNGDLDEIDVLGDVKPEDVWRCFTPHPALKRQLAWHLEGAAQHLHRCCVE
jgi:uncharacterized protein (DUF362 family)